ncbi:glycosyl hydrolase [Micromonospora chersina]|uniref:glycoside hydrolase family 26 protein n=1 Tax=Micromonospora chersina TaxID=47854 RepID=UPI00345490DD
MIRFTFPRVVLVLAGALLLTYAFAVAPTATSERKGGTVTAEAKAPRPRGPFPPAGKTFIGVMTDKGPHDFTPVDRFTAAAGHQPQVMLFSEGWASATFDRALFDRIRDRGMMPMLGWEPWDYRLDEQARQQKLTAQQIDAVRSDQPTYRLSRIAGGEFDTYVRSWAEGIKSLGYPVAIRFAHEMNGYWYPWCELVNGNRPGDYVKAWHHVQDVFRAAGATNVTWVWSPNVRYTDLTPAISTYYPGDDYVDWVGVTGYYGKYDFAPYLSFDEVFKKTITEIRTVSRKPMVITETGGSDHIGRKAEWITEAFQTLPRYPFIIGLIWFEVNKELDWRIVSSPAVTTAFARAVAAPRYQVTWSPDMLPRTKLED